MGVGGWGGFFRPGKGIVRWRKGRKALWPHVDFTSCEIILQTCLFPSASLPLSFFQEGAPLLCFYIKQWQSRVQSWEVESVCRDFSFVKPSPGRRGWTCSNPGLCPVLLPAPLHMDVSSMTTESYGSGLEFRSQARTLGVLLTVP